MKDEEFTVVGNFVISCLTFGIIDDEQEDEIWYMAMSKFGQLTSLIP